MPESQSLQTSVAAAIIEDLIRLENDAQTTLDVQLTHYLGADASLCGLLRHNSAAVIGEARARYRPLFKKGRFAIDVEVRFPDLVPGTGFSGFNLLLRGGADGALARNGWTGVYGRSSFSIGL